jgi:hypothetical protein
MFKPLAGLVLIEPLKLKYKVVKEMVAERLPKNPDDLEKEVEVKEVKNKIKLQQQLAKVIDTGIMDTEKLGFKAGDTIVYDINMVRPFDLVKGTVLIGAHNIIGLWL